MLAETLQVRASISQTRAQAVGGRRPRTQLETGIDAARTNLNAAQGINTKKPALLTASYNICTNKSLRMSVYFFRH